MLKTDLWFPDVEESTEEGIVAVGGDLSVERLILAYSKEFFLGILLTKILFYGGHQIQGLSFFQII